MPKRPNKPTKRTKAAKPTNTRLGPPSAPAKTGRPSSYRDEYADQAMKLCTLGATDLEVADFFGVTRDTIWRWSQTFPAFSDALKAGKDAADERVQRSLFAKAIGYTHDAVKILQHEGTPVIVPYREHVPPDTTAAIFWLKNRRPKEWRENAGQLGTPENPVVVLLQQVKARALPVVPTVEGTATEVESD